MLRERMPLCVGDACCVRPPLSSDRLWPRWSRSSSNPPGQPLPACVPSLAPLDRCGVKQRSACFLRACAEPSTVGNKRRSQMVRGLVWFGVVWVPLRPPASAPTPAGQPATTIQQTAPKPSRSLPLSSNLGWGCGGEGGGRGCKAAVWRRLLRGLRFDRVSLGAVPLRIDAIHAIQPGPTAVTLLVDVHYAGEPDIQLAFKGAVWGPSMAVGCHKSLNSYRHAHSGAFLMKSSRPPGHMSTALSRTPSDVGCPQASTWASGG